MLYPRVYPARVRVWVGECDTRSETRTPSAGTGVGMSSGTRGFIRAIAYTQYIYPPVILLFVQVEADRLATPFLRPLSCVLFPLLNMSCKYTSMISSRASMAEFLLTQHNLYRVLTESYRVLS